MLILILSWLLSFLLLLFSLLPRECTHDLEPENLQPERTDSFTVKLAFSLPAGFVFLFSGWCDVDGAAAGGDGLLSVLWVNEWDGATALRPRRGHGDPALN